ncbi:MAG: ABC transporter ATP-binding protein [Tepidisphaerales bacterium]
MARVELTQVSKIYPGGMRAVDRIDLVIEDREFVVLVGPSGCGKSTTLRMIAGLEEISEGEIRIGGRVVNDVPPKDRDIAMVFQNYALYPHMTVYNNMAFGLKLRGMPKPEIQRRVMEAAKILDIEHLLDRKPKALSGGQRQRVAVGRAIVREPKAFLFDEPLSNLDAKLRVTTRAELKRLHQRLQTTTIYVTHDQEEAMTLGDRIVCMRDGKIQQADTPLETYHRPANRFVAGFIGMPPMNFFDGVLTLKDGDLWFTEGRLEGGGGAEDSARVGVSKAGGGAGGGVGGRLTLPPGGFTIRLPDRLRELLGGSVGQHVVLGVRPEDVSMSPRSDESGEITVQLRVVETLGREMDVYMSTALKDGVVARIEAPPPGADRRMQMDVQTKVYLDLRKIHVFEPGPTGRNMSLARENTHALA